MHVADSLIASGEVDERRSEDKARLEGGPANLVNVITFEPKEEPREVWSSGQCELVRYDPRSNDLPNPPRAHLT